MSDYEQREAAWQKWKAQEAIWGEEPPSRPDFMGGWDAAMAAKAALVQIDREALAQIIRHKTRLGPVGPNARAILAAGGTVHLTPSEAESAADAVIAHLAAQPVARTLEDKIERALKVLKNWTLTDGRRIQRAYEILTESGETK